LSATAPAGLLFADNGNGTATISGTPVAGSARLVPYLFVITAVSQTGTAMQTFKLTVTRAPAFTSAPIGATFVVGTAVAAQTWMTAPGLPAPTMLSVSPKLPAGLVFTDKGNGSATITGKPA